MKTSSKARTTAIRAWGNGYGILLPKFVVDDLELTNAQVQVSVRGTSSIVLTKMPNKQKKVTLAEMVRSVARRPRHEIVDFGGPEGREIW
ncbi:hypothetical protein FJY93_05005 [Candidatus Kaiserbacteria bacterium]|nr:hypothetical protein [Candidatus Kaiserbacteria bacterium]